MVAGKATVGAQSLVGYLKGTKTWGWIWTFDYSVFGVGGVGKTKLDNQMHRYGYHAKDEPSTVGLVPAKRKQVSILGVKRVIRVADVGGQMEYRKFWIDDMAARHPKLIMFLIDPTQEVEPQRQVLKDLCDCLTIFKMEIRPTKRKLVKRWLYYPGPEDLIVAINKGDLFLKQDEMKEINFDTMQSPGNLINLPLFTPYYRPPENMPTFGCNVHYRVFSALTGWNVRESLATVFREQGVF